MAAGGGRKRRRGGSWRLGDRPGERPDDGEPGPQEHVHQADGHQHPPAGEESELTGEEGPAGVALVRRRLVRRWRATHRRCHPGVVELEPVVDREFAEIFLRNVDDPIRTHVMGMFHGWWEVAPESAVDQYLELFRSAPDALQSWPRPIIVAL